RERPQRGGVALSLHLKACGLSRMARRLGATMDRSHLLPKAIGLGTWGLVTLPLWGALVAPWTLAWLVLLFNGYWLLRSSMLGFGAIISYARVRRSERTDWRALAQAQAGFEALHHLVIIPTYKEDDGVLAETLDYLVRQDFPAARV